jgi:hypothetical protein
MTRNELLAVETLKEVLAWCKTDIAGYEEITPDMPMLRARVKHIQETLKAIKNEGRT